MRWRNFALIVFTLTLPIHASANCEIAPYGFHTIAKYGRADNNANYFTFAYKKDDSGLIITGVTPFTDWMYSSGMQGNATKFKIKYKNSVLELPDNKLHLITHNVEWEGLIRIPNDVFDISNIPSRGYGRYVKNTNTLWLTDELAFEKSRSKPGYAESILRDIYDRKIILDKKSNMPVTKSNIADVSYEITTIGKTPHSLRVIIVTLKLKDLDKILTSNRPLRFQGRTADFYLIYFQKGNEPVFYVGDGRDEKCVASRLDMKADGKDKDLGPIYRFDVTGAFDVTYDGLPDFIETNNEITYYLDPSGELLVVHTHTSGC